MKKIILSVLLASGLVCSSALPTFALGGGAGGSSLDITLSRREQLDSILATLWRDIDYLHVALGFANVDHDRVILNIPNYEAQLRERFGNPLVDAGPLFEHLRRYEPEMILEIGDNYCILDFDRLDVHLNRLLDLAAHIQNHINDLTDDEV